MAAAFSVLKLNAIRTVAGYPRSLRLLGLLATLPLVSASSPPQQDKGTIGLVLTDIRFALRETPGAKEECPTGLQAGEVEQFKAEPDFMDHLRKFGGTTQNRGPNGELANYSPMVVEDRLPWRDLQTKLGYGVNLDGTQDGAATARTCRHEKFTSPDGEQVDNQMARVLGCVQGWRKTGFMAEFYSKEVETSPYNRLLVEVTGVGDERNDPGVNVAIYKGRDRLVRMTSGTSFVPFMSHRIDTRLPQYMFTTRGRIIDGELITDPIPLARMAMIQIQLPGERQLRDMSLRLKLDDNGAEGLMAGYENISSWWNIQSKSPGSDVGRYSPALVYRSALRFADGYPDPATGQCTALSVAYQVSAVRALIVHPRSARSRMAMER